MELLADIAAAGRHDHPTRVAIDGPPATHPGQLADAVAAVLPLRGRPAVRISAGDFLRPASVRLEHGRTDPDAFYERWLDVGGLLREVLVPLGPGGSLHYLPSLWDAERDRATRAPYAAARADSVVLLDGALLLTPTLRYEFEVAVHLDLSPGALARRTPDDEHWTLDPRRLRAVRRGSRARRDGRRGRPHGPPRAPGRGGQVSPPGAAPPAAATSGRAR